MAKISLQQRMFWALLLMTNSHTFAAPNIEDSAPLRQKLTVEGIRKHEQALQTIAQQNRNTRVAGSRGYQASVDYVKGRLEAAGYQVSLQEFPFTTSEDHSPPVLVKMASEQKTFVAETDFANMSSMGFAEVAGEIEAVDLKIPSASPNQSTSGCEIEDFKDFKRGNIALVQRGSCPFQDKAENALQAGAVGVVIFNEGNPGRLGLISSRLKPTIANFPVLGATFAVGDELRSGVLHGPTGLNALLRIDVLVNRHLVHNVIAETAAGDPNRVVAVGAHLDSVHEGPGINDNGSGSSTILEIAERFAELGAAPKNKLRFLWFAAEEFGLLGSDFYVNSLSSSEQRKIMAMLNFDMLQSSNYARFVYDGDNSGRTAHNAKSGPDGSAKIERIFLDYFSSIGLANHPTAFDGRSDYGPFIEVGIPAGGLFAGAEGIKSNRLAQIYGGIAGKSFDPCYHRSCDDLANTGGNHQTALALKSLDELSDAAAHAIIRLANSEESIRPPQQLGPLPPVEFEYRGNWLVR